MRNFAQLPPNHGQCRMSSSRIKMPQFNSTGNWEFNSCLISNSTTLFTHTVTGLIGLTLAIFIILLNSFLLFNILLNKIFSAFNILIANLAFVSILMAATGTIYISRLDVLFQNGWICSILSFFRNVGVSLISLSVCSIIVERVRNVDPTWTNGSDLILTRVIGWSWTISFLTSIPALFLTVLKEHSHANGEIHSSCLKARPGDYFGTALLYEVIRSLLFHVAVPGYMISEMYRIRGMLKNLFPFKIVTQSCPRHQRRMQQVRFIFMHTLTFVLLWAPFGIGISIYKNTTLHDRYDRFVQHPELDCEDGNRSGIFYILVVFFYCYILLLPVILFCGSPATFSTFSSGTKADGAIDDGIGTKIDAEAGTSIAHNENDSENEHSIIMRELGKDKAKLESREILNATDEVLV